MFQDWGYKGLYHETAAQIATRKGLPKGEAVLDHMGSTELAANLFRITQADEKLRTMQADGEVTKGKANTTHYAVGQEVRAAIKRIGGTMPEDLATPPESIQQLEQREQKRLESRRQPSLFSTEMADAEDPGN